MRATKYILLALFSVAFFAGSTRAADPDDNPFANNADFWNGLEEDEEPYEHDFTHIPDLINNETVYFWFNQTHQYLLGVERGMYSNDSIVLDEDCFGPRFVTKINEFAAMIKSDPWKHWMLELAIIYQLYFMWSDKCSIDQTINDLYIYMWNYGFEPIMLWENLLENFLYMTRALIDAAIVWYEGVPEDTEHDIEQWHALSR